MRDVVSREVVRWVLWCGCAVLRCRRLGVDALISVLQCRLVPRSQYLRSKSGGSGDETIGY